MSLLLVVGGINLAGGKPTNQSDTLGDAVSSRAVDGNIDSRFYDGQSCSSTTQHADAWWRVDLEKLEFVAHVFIQFRYECCESEATRFMIHVGKSKLAMTILSQGLTCSCNFQQECGEYTCTIVLKEPHTTRKVADGNLM